jgi:hypothetical protein
MGPLSVPQSMAKLLTPTIGVNSLADKLGPLSVPIRGTIFYTASWPPDHTAHGPSALPLLPLPRTLVMTSGDLHRSPSSRDVQQLVARGECG